MSNIKNERQIDYWLDQLNKTKEEDQDRKPFLSYFELIGSSDL